MMDHGEDRNTPVLNEHYIQQCFRSDQLFDQLYPLSVQRLSARHWTPLEVAGKAARFLADREGARILDIGSGAGKFCLSAAYFQPSAGFWGIEQRQHLLHHADAVRQCLGISNVRFLHGNFTQLRFTEYDHFYFYNSFYENLAGSDKIDESMEYSAGLYFYYTRYLYRQLEKMPAGTRIATFHSLEDEIPPDYVVVGTEMDALLKFWIRL